ncbi:MAG TPA: sulfatase-like hydrolase/transferase [Nitrospira sp.]
MVLLNTLDITRNESTPLGGALVFLSGLILAILQAERFFLLSEVATNDTPTAGLLAKTFFLGFVNDLSVAAGVAVIALCLALVPASMVALWGRIRTLQGFRVEYGKHLTRTFVLLTILLICLATADVCYYAYNHQHLDFVFFEYVDELFHGVTADGASQAATQTGAELSVASKWIWRIGGYWTVAGILIVTWRLLFRRFERLGSGLWTTASLAVGLFVVFTSGIGATAGFAGVSFGRMLHIQSEAYYSLSQNVILFAVHPLRDVFLSQWSWNPSSLPVEMTVNEAIQETQAALANGATFPSSEYPLVREQPEPNQPYFGRRVNVLLIFVEGLDRRFLNRLQSVVGAGGRPHVPIRLTPFLDHLKDDSLYFSHFFSNGVQTSRGIFSSLCSAFPRQGTAAIKTRYDHDYLCFPSVLKRAGYRTEMVVSLDADLPGVRTFLSLNDLDRYYGEADFPLDAERLGVGLTDRALLDFVEGRLNALQSSGEPFLLTTLTAGTHHPFDVPNDHPDVKALQQDSDQYLAALRYFDLAFEQFFSRVKSEGLLKNTVVMVLGDHGRHEAIGRTDAERQIGHFLAPLYVWVDDSLRTETRYRPRVLDSVVSQVDIAPTIVALNGLMPRLSPFVGQNVTCLFATDCIGTNRAYLSSVYDDAIGLADSSGIRLYSFRRDFITAVDLDMRQPATHPTSLDASVREVMRLTTALYVASNTLLEDNRLWSRQFFSSR